MSFTRLLAALAVSTATFALPIAGANVAIAQPADFRARAEAMVEAAYPADGPGAAVVVMRGGRVIYAAGRGLADLETRRPITPDSVFKLGSIVKQFTAAVVLQLVAEGRISLDDPIARFFPDFPEPAARATVRQLLNHTSGINDYTKIPGWIARAGTRSWTTAELVAEVRSRPAESEPGTVWEYNNAGYALLGAIVEQVTGRPWHEAVRDRIARPLGLTTIEYAVTGEAEPAMVRGYTDADGRPQPARRVDMSVAGAAGGLVGSAADLARWAQALHHGRVVRPDLYQEMIRPAPLADGSTRPYGMGLRLQQLRGRPVLVHGGAGAGLDTDSVYVPSEDLFVAVFSNSDDPATDPSTLTRRLAMLALGDPFPDFRRAEVPVAAVEPLFGAYRGAAGPDFRFFARDGKYYVARGDDEMEAIPAGGDLFFFGRDALLWVGFTRRVDGAHVLEVHEAAAAEPIRAVRAGAAPPPFTVAANVLRSYAGTWRTETITVTIVLGENGALTLTPAGQGPLPMRPVSETEFRIEGTPMRLVFHPENGAVNRFTMHRGARELHGERVGG